MVKTADVALLESLRAENPSERDRALAEVYQQAYGMIEAMIVKNSGTVADAEDIFHDALISFYKQVQGGLVLTCAIKTYVYSMCRNLWLKRLRKAGRNSQLEDQHQEVVELSKNPEEFLIADDCAGLVATYLKQMGETCKKIIVYSYFDHFKADEIAKLMNYGTAQVARNKKSGCLKKFREMVLQNGERDPALQGCLEAYL